MIRPRCLAAVSSLLLLTVGARAAAPRDELLRLVPDTVGFCVVVQDLRGQAAAFRQSQFFKQIQTSQLGEALTGAPEFRKLLDAEKQLQDHLGVDFAQLRDDILGDAVVLAYQPGPPGQPNQEQGALLVRAGNTELLNKLLARLNELQKQSGELRELQERDHNNKKYQRRVKSKDNDEFVYRNGPILAFSSQEAMVQRIIDLDEKAPAAEKGPAPVTRQLQNLGADRGFLSLWINPRAFDADLARKAEAAKGAEAAFLKQFQVYWKATEGVAVFAGTGSKPELNVAIRTNPLALPQAAVRLSLAASQQSALWAGFPDNALFAMAGRTDLVAMREVLNDFLTEDARRAVKTALDGAGRAMLGRDLTTEVLPLLGPDWGICVMAPPGEEKGWFPHLIAGLRVQPGNKPPPVDRAILNAINSFVLLGMFDYNLKHPDLMTLRAMTQDKVELKYLTSDGFPPGLQPALGLKEGHLVLASSPAAFARFQAKPAGLAGLPGTEVPLLRLSLRDLRTYLKDRREALVAYAVQKNQLTADEANGRMDRLLAGLELFDRMDLGQRFTLGGNVTWTLRLQPSAAQVKPEK